jgi:drug/metabolite transporter (DMT)-like permease
MLLWASAFVVIRAVAVHYNPGAMAAGRLLVGTAALTAFAALRHRSPLSRGRPLVFVLGYGVLWFGIYALCLNAAERYLDAGTAALLVNVGSIVVAVLAGVLLGEGLPRALAPGAAGRAGTSPIRLWAARSGLTVVCSSRARAVAHEGSP